MGQIFYEKNKAIFLPNHGIKIPCLALCYCILTFSMQSFMFNHLIDLSGFSVF